MLSILIPLERSGASVQRRIIWQNIEAGTRIVMRFNFERLAFFTATYECRLGGESNKPRIVLSGNSLGWLTDGSLDWFVLCIR